MSTDEIPPQPTTGITGGLPKMTDRALLEDLARSSRRTCDTVDRLVHTVDSSTGCTGITAGGVAFTSFAIDDATHVSGIPGAHAAGVVDVVVTNATGPSTTGTGLTEYFDPTSICDEYLDGTQYVVGTWTARKGVNATEATNAPAVGSGARQLGGRNTVDFDGVNDRLQCAGNIDAQITSGQGWFAAVFNADTAAANATPVYTNAALCTDNQGFVMMGFSDAGLRGAGYDGAYKEPTAVAATTAAWHLGKAYWDSTNFKQDVDSGANTSVACGAIANVANPMVIGVNYNSTVFFDGRFAVLATAKVIPSAGDILKFRGVINQQWGTTF